MVCRSSYGRSILEQYADRVIQGMVYPLYLSLVFPFTILRVAQILN